MMIRDRHKPIELVLEMRHEGGDHRDEAGHLLSPARLYREFSRVFEPFNIDLVFMDEVDTLFQYGIIRGVRIYAKDEGDADLFEETVMKKAGDLLFKKRLMNKEIMEAVEDGYFEFEYKSGA